MLDRLLIRVISDALSVDEAVRFVSDPAAGATCVFLGTVRDNSNAGEVTGLTYEAWEEQASERLRAVGEEMLERWPSRRAALLHRIGSLGIGEVSVVVASSAPHRPDAFAACRHGIERIKQDAPIWKKEALADGDARWVVGS
ncbi:MAG: molybdenum cofactor biosynthesis protein MoaE [Actinomycetota bacterium]